MISSFLGIAEPSRQHLFRVLFSQAEMEAAALQVVSFSYDLASEHLQIELEDPQELDLISVLYSAIGQQGDVILQTLRADSSVARAITFKQAFITSVATSLSYAESTTVRINIEMAYDEIEVEQYPVESVDTRVIKSGPIKQTDEDPFPLARFNSSE